MDTSIIFGPPGTGKTTEMIRLLNDAAQRGFDPSTIGFFSFTKAAAKEAQSRIGGQSANSRYQVSTLHGLAFRAANATPMQMVDGWKLRKFGKEAGIEFRGVQSDEYGEGMGIGDQYLAIQQLARSRLASIKEEYYNSDRPGSYIQYVHCLESYDNWKKAMGYLDFTDLLEIYCADPKNHGSQILFLDEAQDLSPLQWKMIGRMLEFDQVREVSIAGDDDQAIFEWAGADPGGMTKFGERYQSKSRVLAQSYRVPRAVHDLARGVVSGIQGRVKKSYRPAPRDGLVERHGGGFEASMVTHGDDVMVLCRSHSQKTEVESELIKHRVPYRVDGGKPGLFDSAIAKAIRLCFKMEGGHCPAGPELEALAKVATDAGRRMLNDKDYRGFSGKMWSNLKIPIQYIDFFKGSDMSQTPTVRVSTIHAAKGREARKVVLHTGITKKTGMAMDLNPDPEHRVWYVGVTRAKEELAVVAGPDECYPL